MVTEVACQELPKLNINPRRKMMVTVDANVVKREQNLEIFVNKLRKRNSEEVEALSEETFFIVLADTVSVSRRTAR